MEKMKAYDIRCPVCGTVNHSLFLQETDGWLECESCGVTSRVLSLRPVRVFPREKAERVPAHGVRFAANL